jgi:hypothetical protein
MNRIFLLTFIAISVVSACKKNEDSVSNIAVNEYIDLNLPSYFSLNAVNGWMYYPSGGKGIIIFRRSLNEFTALERTCTFDPSASCSLVEVETNNILGVDSCCNSKFSLFDGSIINGPATRPLQQYRTQLLNNNVLHIFN